MGGYHLCEFNCLDKAEKKSNHNKDGVEICMDLGAIQEARPQTGREKEILM